MPRSLAMHNADLYSRIIPSLAYLHNDELNNPSDMPVKRNGHTPYHSVMRAVSEYGVGLDNNKSFFDNPVIHYVKFAYP